MGFRSLLIAVAIFGLGWGASFGAGIAYGKRGTGPQVQAATFPGAGGAQTGNGFGGQGGRGAFGTVASVDGRTLTLTEANNQQVKVTLTDQTQIFKQAAGTAADLTAGARVTVQPQGQPAWDGTITAATINVVPADAAGAAAAGGAAGGQRAGQNGQGGQRQANQQGQPAAR